MYELHELFAATAQHRLFGIRKIHLVPSHAPPVRVPVKPECSKDGKSHDGHSQALEQRCGTEVIGFYDDLLAISPRADLLDSSGPAALRILHLPVEQQLDVDVPRGHLSSPEC